MPSFRTGRVTRFLSTRRGLQRVEIDLGGRLDRAYVLTGLVGPVAEGDEVVVNTTAVDLDLGTGGWHVVHWNLARTAWRHDGGGHVMKLRYTSLQADTGVAEEVNGYEPPPGLGGRPVVACFLHSQLPCVAAAFATAAPGRRLVYVMTDDGALPLALSDLVAGLEDAGLLAASVTAGHAFGGDHEAVNLASALDVAVACAGADAVVVAPGPGVVGTGTARGFSGLSVAGTIDAAAQAGGRPVLAVRFSGADPRARHRGVSHHVTATLSCTHHRTLLPIPVGERPDPLPPGLAAHELRTVEDVPDVDARLRAAGLVVTTMGRSAADDPAFFRWSAAAGTL
ncbi:MAG: DUF3866 family protein, partial [Acidimicrobiales bacterium]